MRRHKLLVTKNYNETTSEIFHETFSRFLERDSTDSAGLELEEMSPLDYEQYCAALLRTSGWEARTTVATGDQGVDIVAMCGLTKIVGQCKLYSSPVGNAAVQQVIGGREFEQAHHAFVVTNAGFTLAARALAASANVVLMHHSELADLHTKLNVPVAQTPRQTQAPLSESAFQISETSKSVFEIVKDAESLMAKACAEGITPRNLLGANWGNDYPNGEKDPMYGQAVEVVLKNRKASNSLVQRHLKIGYNRAARLVEDMEYAGLVSAMSGSGQREILVPVRAE